MKITPLQAWIAHKIGCPNQALSRTRMRAYQLQKLQETTDLVREKSQFYRHRLAKAPQKLNRLEDLTLFPFTTAADIGQNPLQFLCVSQGDIHRVVTLNSSGTTNIPKRLYFTQADQQLTIDFFHIGMSTLTGAGEQVLILLPGERPGSVGDLLATALTRLGAVGLKHGPVQDISKTLALMRQEKVDCLVGIPTQVLALARYPTSGPPLKLKSVLLTTDYVPEAIVRAVERKWGCRVYNHYGMTEMGLGGGVECQARQGYHLREADLYFEIVDPATGQPVTPGQPGEIIFTTLTRQGMPLLRYRTGDTSRFIPTPCPCGTVLPRLERVRSRLEGYLTIGAGQSLIMADLDDALFPLEGVVNFSARIIPKAGPKRLLQLEVKVVRAYKDSLSTVLGPAIASIPAIHQAQQTGQLEVAVTIQEQDESILPVPAKRIIGSQ